MKRTRDEKEHGVVLESKRSSGIHCDDSVLEVGGEQQDIWLQRGVGCGLPVISYAKLRS